MRLQSFTAISPKCYKATSFDGSEDLIPASQYFGQDYEVSKSEAHWISEWILKKKKLQYSTKKQAFFDSDTGKMLPKKIVKVHTPAKKQPVKAVAHESLTR